MVAGLVPQASFSDLSETPPDDEVPWLDRANVDESALTHLQRQWRNQGFIILKNVVQEPLLQAYESWRKRRRLPPHLGVLPNPYGYMFVPEVRAIGLLKNIAEVMAHMLGEPQVLQFDLTQWLSTERAWHQDDYLNPPWINGRYAAVWFAIDDISPDAGPFEYVPGSNRWPVMRGEKVRALLPPELANDPRWAEHSQHFVAQAFEKEIARRGEHPFSFLAERGDVLIWHARLVHRGSLPRIHGMPRKSLICHYRGISTLEPEYHEVLYQDGVPYIHHRGAAFSDWGSETGVITFAPG